MKFEDRILSCIVAWPCRQTRTVRVAGFGEVDPVALRHPGYSLVLGCWWDGRTEGCRAQGAEHEGNFAAVRGDGQPRRAAEVEVVAIPEVGLGATAALTITAQGSEIAFGAMEAGLEVEYARDSIGFRWAGSDEGDEVQGEGTAELLDDGTIEIEFAYDNGDEAVLKAKRDPSSTAC